MKPDHDWKFSAAINKVDVVRVLREAGRNAKCVRFTIDDKVYTAMNILKATFLPPVNDVSDSAKSVAINTTDGWQVCEDTVVFRGDDGQPLVATNPESEGTPWFLYHGDRTGEVMDRTKVLVEVFE